MGEANRGKRRFFSAEFEREAVRRMEVERARGVSLTQIGGELGVRPDLRREGKRQAMARGTDIGTAVTDVFPGQGRLPSEAEELLAARCIGRQARPMRSDTRCVACSPCMPATGT